VSAAHAARILCTAAVAAVALLGANDLRGQSSEAAAMACVQNGGGAEACTTAAVTARGIMGQLGLLAGGGSEIPGSATSLGTRVGGGPRMTFFARGAAVGMSLPEVGGASDDVLEFAAMALQGGAAVGLWDGLRIMPTVGGFLSLDAFLQGSLLFLPGSEGFDGNSEALTAGVRLGILREGFTVPGISLTASRRFVGEVGFGPTGTAVPTVLVDPAVTSLRAVVGKDLFAVELLGGVGWDDYSGDVVLRVFDDTAGLVTTTTDLSGSRLLYFGSASMTFGIVLSISAQVGWAEGLGPVEGFTGRYDPEGGTLFGWFSARLTL
jgi:hypothetical protein